MFGKSRNEAYPILNGKAMVRVQLRKKPRKISWFDKLGQRIKYYLVNREIRSLSPSAAYELIPVVRLNRRDNSCAAVEKMEFNLVQDSYSFFQKAHIAVGGLVAAGLIMVSAWGLTANGKSFAMRKLEPAPGANFTNSEKARTPIIAVESQSEEILLASLSQPMSIHPFNRVGHTNTNLQHHNFPGGGSHSNIQPGNTHSDNPGVHQNSAHLDYAGHHNIPHADYADASSLPP